GVKLAGDEGRVRMRSLRAQVLAWAERFAEAEAECRAVLAERPSPKDERLIRLRLANVFAEARQFARAAEPYRLVIELAPRDAGRAAEAWRKAAGLYATEKRPKGDPRADEVRRKLEKLAPPSR